ncbi:PTS sugar transporter subunit IIB [Salinibacillus xinjiangensis]|uniref:PTS ascorbate transporter subunit IIB n=1 Tax=Salinibacillus xinjiangensis TaxID=1229268 RepID=A0A6G1X1T5_9BACI|nr:PTS sugar transporter subunit IIB [Salinibacillus xinjiangensis]MRG84943.1 PTS ascorbate transporter subunit IIB [Salinibacillus xinjiangensis]
MKILCVCGLGQGTSLILRMNVETVLREMGIDAEVENTDVSSAAAESPDYIITSNELSQSLEGHSSKIVIVNNYFDTEEIKTALEANMN